MSSLGERLTAQRDAQLDALAKLNAPTPVENIAAVIGDAVKSYVDDRIAQIVTENNLSVPAPVEPPPLVIPMTDSTVTITTSDGANVVSTDPVPTDQPAQS